MKLLLDEMWPSTIAEQLRRRGHDVVAVVERDDLHSKPDPVILELATSEHRAVVTENVGDFRVAARVAIQRGDGHAGLVFTSNRRFSRHDPRIVGRMLAVLSALLEHDPDLTNQEHWLD